MNILTKKIIVLISFLIVYLTITTSLATESVSAATAAEIDASTDAALENFYSKVHDGKNLIDNAKGVLIFPNVYKAGFVLGAEYGEGALRVKGATVDYYSTTSGSFGWQLGAQKKSLIMLFMDDNALSKLRTSSNWKAGVDASVTVIAIGADGSIDTQKLNKPIIAFVIGQKGLMYNLTLEGTKLNKLNK